MFCSRCGTKNPENSAYCYNCGQNMASPPDVSELKDIDVKTFKQELRDDAASLKNNEAALNALMHLFFFSVVDRNGVTRFFDIMKDENGYSLAETATNAPRLSPCPCRESVFETRDRAAFHHVHRLYCEYPTAQAARAHLAMQMFANHFGLTQVTEIAETLTGLQALPTWDIIFQKLGCPTGRLSFKSRSIFSE